MFVSGWQSSMWSSSTKQTARDRKLGTGIGFAPFMLRKKKQKKNLHELNQEDQRITFNRLCNKNILTAVMLL